MGNLYLEFLEESKDKIKCKKCDAHLCYEKETLDKNYYCSNGVAYFISQVYEIDRLKFIGETLNSARSTS